MPGLKRPLAREDGKKPTTKKARPEERQSAASAPITPKEVDFPRGGGSSLTPFEHQQVLREVKAEASEAQAKRSKQQQSVAASEDLFTDGDAKRKLERKKLNRDRKNATKKKTSTSAASSSAPRPPKDDSRPQRIEVLNYKRLATGTRMLCSVLAVHPLAVVLSLPNQLLGHVPITNISDIFTARLEGAADESEVEKEGDDDSQGEDDDDGSVRSGRGSKEIPELRELFHVGQWVIASVVSVQTGGPVKGERGREGGEYEEESRKVELTLEPSAVNDGITVSDLASGFLLPMAVRSREDHGYLMETGIKGLGGFVAFKDAQDKTLQDGQVVKGSILSLAENGRSASASLKPSKTVTSQLSSPPTIAGLMPGNLVKTLVTASSASGVNVKLFGLFDATVDSFHMDHDAEYTVGQHLIARILWDIGPIGAEGAGASINDDSPVNQRKIALSAAAHVVKLDSSGSLAANQAYPIGAIVEATVLSTIEDWGLTSAVKGSSLKGFIHISSCSDSHVISLPTDSGPFRVGTKHKARVVGHSSTDQVLQLSLRHSILSRSFMRVSEVMVGDVVKSTIKSISPKGIILDLNGSVDGVVFPLHFADIPLRKPEKKYKIGQSVKARVWKVDPERNRVALTLKKSLVQSELAVVATLQDARVGVVTHGTVAKLLEGNAGPSAVLVDLFGQLRAFVPISEAIEAGSSSDSIRNSFFLGKCVKLRLTRVDYDTGRITASIRQASESYLKRLNVDAVQVGETVQGKLAAVHQDVVVLELEPSNVRALIGLNALAKVRKTSVEELRGQLMEGEVIGNLKVVDKSAEKGIVILGGPSAKAKTNDASLSQGSIVSAKVTRSEKNAVRLHIGQNVRGHLHITDCLDDYGSAPNATSILPQEGTVVSVYCLNVKGGSSKKAEVSIRPSRLQPTGEVQSIRDEEVNEVAELQVGTKKRGFVKAMAEKGGLFVDLGRKVTARVMIAELFDSYIKDWTSRFTIGQLVEGTVTSVEVHQNKVEMSLRKEPGKSSKGKGKEKKAEGVEGDSSSSSRLTHKDLHEGQKVKAFVKSITEYGLFLQIEGSNLSGLAHKSQLSDDNSSADVVKAFSIGDRVKAKVLKVDGEKRKLSFGLKPSLFYEADFEDSGDEDEEGSEGSEEDREEADSEEGSEVEMDASALLDADDSDDEELLQVDSGSGDGEGDDSEGEDDSDEEDSDEGDSDLPLDLMDVDDGASDSDGAGQTSAMVAPALELAGGFNWSAGPAVEESEASSDEGESSSDEKREQKKKRKGKGGKKAQQDDLTADLATKTPESTQDFERLLLGSPNSSFLWIQYISFQLQLGDIAKAREVARRALQVINFREEQEKFNVWIAMLNLENTFGGEESLEETYREACAYNDDKTVSLRFAEILERSGKVDKAEEQWKRTTKKFGFSSQVWIEYHRFLLRSGRKDEARGMIVRSMQSLEKRKHVETVVAYALDDFRIGDAERGRTVFEGLVDTYPKRLDIWWQYIDQETRGKNVAQVRDLFERILSLKQSSKKVKSVLKKWLEFEKRHGDQVGQTAVLNRARRFVEERAQQQQGQEGEDAEGEDAEEDE